MVNKQWFHDRLARRVLRWAVRYAIRRGEHFATYNERPKLASQIGTWPERGAPAF